VAGTRFHCICPLSSLTPSPAVFNPHFPSFSDLPVGRLCSGRASTSLSARLSFTESYFAPRVAA